jgi:acetylornithine/LysW-gamma-L-lysine aminotransferase
VDVSPAHYEKVFLCNSGTESVEAAIKAARTTTGKTEIISLIRGFHDKSLGNLSATWDKNYQELFMPLVPGFTHVPANKLDKLEAALTDNTAAVIMEVVQGEGSVQPLKKDYVQAVRKLCQEKGVLLIEDEVHRIEPSADQGSARSRIDDRCGFERKSRPVFSETDKPGCAGLAGGC